MTPRYNSPEHYTIHKLDHEHNKAEMERLGRELEPVFQSFLTHIGKDVFKNVERATKTEDQEGNDFFAELKNGQYIAIQLSFAQDPETQRNKLNDIMTKPVMSERYNEKHEKRKVEPYVRVLMSGGNPASWKRAKELHDTHQGAESYFTGTEASKKSEDILGQLPKNIDLLVKSNPQYKQILTPYQDYFKETIPDQKSKTAHANN